MANCNLKKLDLHGWQSLLDKFLAEKNPKGSPAIRIENTQFTPARYYGGMTYNGSKYTYFEPVIPDEPNNPDGTPKVAWLMVRDDFLKFAKKEAKKTEESKRNSIQGEFLT